ncbi:MAG: DNA repair protein RecO [Clostridiales bacterium]|nr:DNA repair protein RecO [Clostridiales bacterium]
MPASVTIVTGMVLSAMPVGDYDKRLVLLTRELGKISAFAKGARRPNSALLACSQPFSFGQFSLYVGRNSYSITSADISNYFQELRDDIASVYYGMYFCEFSEYVTKENNDEREILKLLYQTLRAVAKKTIELPLVRVIFEFKILALSGVAPQVFECVKCGKDNQQYRFSVDSGGLLCEDCKTHDTRSIRLSISSIYTLQYIISKDIGKLYTFRVSKEILNELITCVRRYRNHYIDREFKSSELLRIL